MQFQAVPVKKPEEDVYDSCMIGGGGGCGGGGGSGGVGGGGAACVFYELCIPNG